MSSPDTALAPAATDAPKMTPKAVLGIFKGAATGWLDDSAMRLSAALSYYTVFSLAPLLVLVVSVVGFFWGSQNATIQANLVGQMRAQIGPEAADAIAMMLENTDRPGSGSTLATVLGVVALLIGATALFGQIQEAINTVWGVKPDPKQGAIWSLVRQRLLSFGMILTVCFVLLVSLVLSAIVGYMTQGLGETGAIGGLALQLINIGAAFVVVTVLFALIFRYLPDATVEWRDVWVGALVTALLFSIGRVLIGLYLGRSSTASAYGAAGSLAVLLVWVYYTAMILLFGAEVTQVYATRFGSGVRPSEHAVRVVTQTVEVDPDEVRHATNEEAKRAISAGQVTATKAAPGEPGREFGALPAAIPRPLWKVAVPVAAAFVVGRWTRRNG